MPAGARAIGLQQGSARSPQLPVPAAAPAAVKQLLAVYAASCSSSGSSSRSSEATRHPHHAGAGRRQGVACAAGGQSGSSISLFPAGAQQASVELPALMLQVAAGDVLGSPELLDAVSKAVAAGATGVIVAEGSSAAAAGAGGAAGGAGALYEAAVRLRDALRGRAPLLVVDRTDIALAAEADGVLLTDAGGW